MNDKGSSNITDEDLRTQVVTALGLAPMSNDPVIERVMQLIKQDRERLHNELTDNERKVWLYREDLDRRIREAEIALARKVLGVSSLVHKQRGVTQSMRLKHLTKEMLRIIPDSGFITTEDAVELHHE